MKPTARQRGESNVARDNDLLSGGRDGSQSKSARWFSFMHGAANQTWIFAVNHDRQAERTRGLQGLAHDPRVSRRLAVVREPNRASHGQRVEVDRSLTAPPFADSGNRMHRDQCIASGASLQLFEGNDRVERGLGIRHAEYRCESPGCRGGSPRFDRLFPLLTGFPEVDMDVDQTRCNDQSIDVHRPLSRFRIELADGRNDTVVNADVSDSIDGVTWV